MPSFQVLVLGFLFVSFRPSLIRSHSCSSGAYLVPSLSVFPLPIRFLSSASLPVPATQPLFLPFLSLPRFASQLLFGCRLSTFRLPCFSTSAPPGFPCFPSISKYSAFCLFPFIPPGFAPTAVPPVLPFCSRFRAFPSLPLSFVRFRSVLTTQPSALSFPFFPFSPVGGSSGASFLFRPACFHAFLPIPVLSFLQFLSPFTVSPHSGYLSASAFSLSVPGLFPLAFALGSGYLALERIPYRYLPAASFLFSLSDLTYTSIRFFICQLLFFVFLNFF